MSSNNNKALVLYIGIALGALAVAAVASVCVCKKNYAPSEDDLPRALKEAHQTVQRLTEAIESLKS